MTNYNKKPLHRDLLKNYAIIARKISCDWIVLKDGMTYKEALQEAFKAKDQYDIIRIYRFISGDI